jgi:hypothetical protein
MVPARAKTAQNDLLARLLARRPDDIFIAPFEQGRDRA